jgi:hypothetical protein
MHPDCGAMELAEVVTLLALTLGGTGLEPVNLHDVNEGFGKFAV